MEVATFTGETTSFGGVLGLYSDSLLSSAVRFTLCVKGACSFVVSTPPGLRRVTVGRLSNAVASLSTGFPIDFSGWMVSFPGLNMDDKSSIKPSEQGYDPTETGLPRLPAA